MSNNFVYSKTLDNFQTSLDNGDISDCLFAIIEDGPCMWFPNDPNQYHYFDKVFDSYDGTVFSDYITEDSEADGRFVFIVNHTPDYIVENDIKYTDIVFCTADITGTDTTENYLFTHNKLYKFADNFLYSDIKYEFSVGGGNGYLSDGEPFDGLIEYHTSINEYTAGKYPGAIEYVKYAEALVVNGVPFYFSLTAPYTAYYAFGILLCGYIELGDMSSVQSVLIDGEVEVDPGDMSIINFTEYENLNSTYGIHRLKFNFKEADDVQSIDDLFKTVIPQIIAIGNIFFDDLKNITSAESCFKGCSGLTSLPDNLFSNCTLLETVESCFEDCSGLTSLPDNLFSNCTLLETVESCFEDCSGLTSLPDNLFSNCTLLETAESCFEGCSGLTSLPDNLFSNCTLLETVESCFEDCSGLTSLPVNLFSNCALLETAESCFEDCSELTDIAGFLFNSDAPLSTLYRCFYNCTGLTYLKYGIIGNLSNCTNFKHAFYNCTSLTFALGSEDDTFDPDTMLHDGDTYDETKSYAFYDITYDNINFRQMFYGCTGIQTIPDGLIESISGLNNQMECMFEACTGITSLSLTSVEGLHVSNARGMFGGCINLSTSLPYENEDWTTYEGLKRWFGAFANTSLSDIDDVCLELGGDGDRMFPDRHVGAIVLEDRTLVDPKNYEYDSDNIPIGIVYADVYLDPDKSVSTLEDGVGNVVDDETEDAEHKLFCTVLKNCDSKARWVYNASNAEDITTIANSENLDVCYNSYVWTKEDDLYNAVRQDVRYNGEAYYNAIMEWQVSQGYIDDISDLEEYTDTNYYAANYCYLYSDDGMEKGTCFLPDATSLWDQLVMNELIQKACDAIIAGGSHTSDTCYTLKNVTTNYWSSVESGEKYAVYLIQSSFELCTNKAIKNSSYVVRPSFSITV